MIFINEFIKMLNAGSSVVSKPSRWQYIRVLGLSCPAIAGKDPSHPSEKANKIWTELGGGSLRSRISTFKTIMQLYKLWIRNCEFCKEGSSFGWSNLHQHYGLFCHCSNCKDMEEGCCRPLLATTVDIRKDHYDVADDNYCSGVALHMQIN